jgi:hypothetical protein
MFNAVFLYASMRAYRCVYAYRRQRGHVHCRHVQFSCFSFPYPFVHQHAFEFHYFVMYMICIHKYKGTHTRIYLTSRLAHCRRPHTHPRVFPCSHNDSVAVAVAGPVHGAGINSPSCKKHDFKRNRLA